MLSLKPYRRINLLITILVGFHTLGPSKLAAKDPEPTTPQSAAHLDHTPVLRELDDNDVADSEEEIKILRDARVVYQATLRYADKRKQELGEAQFLEAVDTGHIVEEVPGLGRGKLGLIDGTVFVRVLLDEYKLSIPFVQVEEHSDHLQRYIARQKMNGGRDVLLVKQEPSGDVYDVRFTKKPNFRSKKWFTEFYHSVRSRPTKGDYILGGVCGVFQGSMTLCLNIAREHFAADGLPILEAAQAATGAAIMTTAFATIIGSYCSVYKNIVYNGTQTQRVLKSSLISMLFAYSFVGLIDGWSTVNPFNPNGLTRNLFINMNVLFTQYTRDSWLQVVRGRAELRLSQGEFSIGNLDTGIKLSNTENQMVYNFAMFPLKLMDLIHFQALGLPVGKIAFYASIPFVRLYNKFWFERKVASLRKEYEEDPNEERKIALTKFEKKLVEVSAAWKVVLHTPIPGLIRALTSIPQKLRALTKNAKTPRTVPAAKSLCAGSFANLSQKSLDKAFEQ